MNGHKLNRKDFFKTLAVTGAGTTLAMLGCGGNENAGKADAAQNSGQYPAVPTRPLGNTGMRIPVVFHGIMYNLVENQIVLGKAFQWGMNMVDTSHGYAGGNSELGIGKYLKRHPEKRKDIIIVSKASGAYNVQQVEEKLQRSLKRMNTDYIDIYYGVHGLSDPDELTPELRRWAENAKKRGVIKKFGFSTHRNMAACLQAASRLDWIDVIMTSFNFRLMQDDDMDRAVDACHAKGIGLIAMKVMALNISTSGDKELTRHFTQKGYTDGQAKLKAVLDDKRIAGACVTMQNTALIMANAAAALDKTSLGRDDHRFLRQYAAQTCDDYCAGCASICDGALPEAPVVSDVMRYLMYYNSYGEEKKARDLFRKEIPAATRRKLADLDYSAVERACPRNLPLGRFMAEALDKLA
jgi:hypothetical protein